MKPVTYISYSAGILAASLLGAWIFFFLLPDVRPLTGSERGLWVVALILMLPTVLLLLVASLLPPGTEIWALLICSLVSALMWPFLAGLVARRWKRKNPDASPNGGRAAGFGNSGAVGGPRSVI